MDFIKSYDISKIGRTVVAVLMAVFFISAGFVTGASAADGDLDTSFGTGGIVKTGFYGGFDAAWKIAMQSDGKIVTAGVAATDFTFDQVIALARHNADGSLDQSFGSGGKVLTDILSFNGLQADVAIQTDGKIIVVGTYGPGFGGNMAIARFNPDGSPDLSFGVGGKVIADPFSDNEEALGVVVQNDGKIVVAGAVQQGPFAYDFVLARFETDGTPDGTFGTGGGLRTDFGGSERANGIALQSDGKIIAVGGIATNFSNGDFAIARYETNGDLDSTFGAGGKVVTDITGYDEASSIAIQTDGKIVVAGGAGRTSTATADFAVVRYETNGSPDAMFGNGGKVTTDFFNALDYANDVVIQPDGKIVLAGWINPDLINVELHVDFGLARYETNGSPDAAFGTGGKVTTDFSYIDEAGGVAILSNCKIIVAGYSWQIDTGISGFTLASYESGVAGCVAEPPSTSTCPKTHGYWKNHPELWPVDSLMLGSQVYTKTELLALLSNSTQTDASIVLARQLIAAKLNVFNGSDPAPAANSIANADSVLSGLSGKLPYKIKSSSSVGKTMTVDANMLDTYNNGLLTTGCQP